jgi:large conductance mechanosensitive channel
MIREFRAFILRGNLIDLAIAVVIGAAFGSVVSSLVRDLITPLIAAIGGQPNFGALTFTIGDGVFHYGRFVNALISFLVIATAIFFLVLKPVNALLERFATEHDVERETCECPEGLSAIPLGARRCAFCTADVAPA